MNKILLSSSVIIFTVGGLLLGGTGAFFSDTETSSGNTFTAGAIDLKIDNTSYYNGVLNEGTTWTLTDLTEELFFDFDDLKPGDFGEDTISLHVDTNDAYICADVTLTSNDDNGLTEPEMGDGDATDGAGNGELAQNVHFIWWADDGDNVLENNEDVISRGPLGALALNTPYKVTIADSITNIWNGIGGPIPGDETRYIGKAWCFGELTESPITQDGQGFLDVDENNIPENGPDIRGAGFSCNGSLVDNTTQTDLMTADISFSAVQARHNTDFVCESGTCEFDENLNLITNGSFEDPDVTSGAQWDIFDSPIAGWLVDWRSDIPVSFNSTNRPVPAKIELHEGVLGGASDGDQYTELDSDWNGHVGSLNNEPASTKIYQNISTTPGASYTLRFAFSPRPNTGANENQLQVMWGGGLVTMIGPVAGGGAISWTEYDFEVTATTTTTQLSFTDMGTANSLGTFLDNVRLYQESCGPGGGFDPQ